LSIVTPPPIPAVYQGLPPSELHLQPVSGGKGPKREDQQRVDSSPQTSESGQLTPRGPPTPTESLEQLAALDEQAQTHTHTHTHTHTQTHKHIPTHTHTHTHTHIQERSEPMDDDTRAAAMAVVSRLMSLKKFEIFRDPVDLVRPSLCSPQHCDNSTYQSLAHPSPSCRQHLFKPPTCLPAGEV
jgi:hypothetical protein